MKMPKLIRMMILATLTTLVISLVFSAYQYNERVERFKQRIEIIQEDTVSCSVDSVRWIYFKGKDDYWHSKFSQDTLSPEFMKNQVSAYCFLKMRIWFMREELKQGITGDK